MITDEYEVLLHRYLDGDLDAPTTLRVEEHLRTSPASRHYYEELKALDRELQLALGELPARVNSADRTSLEERIQDRCRAAWSDRTSGPSIHRIEHYRIAVRGLRIAAALLLLAVGAQIVLLLSQGGTPSDPGTVDSLRSRIAELEQTNDQLTRQNRNLARRASPGHPSPARPGMPALPEPATGDASGAEPTAPDEPVADKPDKKAIFSSIQGLLEAFQKTGRWDSEQERRIVTQLATMGQLSHEDFLKFRHWFEQQEQHTYGQEFLAQVISRFCTHDRQAREFIYSQVESDLQRMAAKEGYLGDRYLRRAWTAGLVSVEDARNTRLLYSLGLRELDETNRGQIYHGLSQMGTSDAAYKLADLALHELNGILKSDSLEYLYDMLYTDPSIGDGLDPAFFQVLQEIIQGNFGANGEYTDAMLWALRILSELNFPTDGLKQEWQNRHNRENGGDPRSGNPRGHPTPDKTQKGG